jgi:hypothetical protein
MECPALLPALMRETGQKDRSRTKRKKHTPEQILRLLRQIEVAVENGKTYSFWPRTNETITCSLTKVE